MTNAAAKKPKPKHDDRDCATGKFRKSPACDCCGKPTGEDYMTDDEVCGQSDGPGFFLCDRKRCAKKRQDLTVEARRELYEAQREVNQA